MWAMAAGYAGTHHQGCDDFRAWLSLVPGWVRRKWELFRGAKIGLTKGKARAMFKSHDLLIKSFDISKVNRAVNEDDRFGLIKIVALSNASFLAQASWAKEREKPSPRSQSPCAIS